MIGASPRRFVEMAGERGFATPQERKCRGGKDSLEKAGDELPEHAPGAGPGQAAASAGGESSSSSTDGSSKRIISKWARI